MDFRDSIFKIHAHVSQNGGRYGEWYVGIAKDPEERLFVQHHVDKIGCWIYLPADSSQIARDVESHLISEGMDGGPGGGDNQSRFVYSYKKEFQTNP